MEYITSSSQETKSLGRKIGSSLKGGEILALVGGLGAGKTTFVQGLAEGLGITSKIISPTFILLRKHGNLYHLDLYRLEDRVEHEVENLGLTDIWGRKDSVVVIEWAEKIKQMLPKETKWITFENIGEDERKITVE